MKHTEEQARPWIKAGCCFVCKKSLYCGRSSCHFYSVAAGVHGPDTILSAVCLNPCNCPPCESGFELLPGVLREGT